MFWRWECSFTVDAERHFVFAQREHFITAALAGLSGQEGPMMHIRGYNGGYPHEHMSLLLFRWQRAQETEDDATHNIDAGLADLRVALEGIGQSRTFVTVECLAKNILPSARAILQEFARRYSEAKDAIESALKDETSAPDPCDVIPEGWQRQAVKLWRQGYSAPEIGERLNYDAKTVSNRLSELRQAYGEEIVPTDAQRRQRLKK